MRGLVQDLRFGVRLLVQNSGFAVIAIGTLALGVGAAAAMFSVLDAVLLKPLPYPESDRLVWVGTHWPSLNTAFLLSPEYVDWAAHNQVFTHMAAYPHNPGAVVITGMGEPFEAGATRVTPNFFHAIGVQPELGRPFRPEESRPGGEPVAMVGDGLARQLFGSARAALGRQLTIDGTARTLVGVLPPAFRFPINARIDVLTPIPLNIPEIQARRVMSGWDVVGRLKPGVTMAQARANLEALFAGTRREQQKIYRNDVALRVSTLQEHRTGEMRLALWILFGAVLMVLLIACANIANLLLSRGVSRERELAIRASLGASRARLIRQMLSESALMAVLGGAAGLAVAWALVKFILGIAPRFISGIVDASLDGRVLLFALAASCGAAVLFGTMPALSATRLHRGGPARGGMLRDVLVAAEFGLSLVLLVGAGLLLESFWRVHSEGLGFRIDDVLTVTTTVRGAAHPGFARTLVERVRETPGVLSAAVADSAPPHGGSSWITFSRPDRPLPEAFHRGDGMVVRRVGAGYFETLGIPLLRGRTFTDADQPGAVAIVNQTLAQRYYGGEEVIGSKIGRPPGWTIVGVVADARNRNVDPVPDAEMCTPFPLDSTASSAELVTRTAGNAAPALRAEFQRLDPNMLATFQTMPQALSEVTTTPRLEAALLGSFATLALVLTAIGLYGVLASVVGQRRRELAIRMAIGAKPGQVAGLVMGRAGVLAGAGLALGIAGSLALTRMMKLLLYGVSPTDPLAFVAVVIALLVTGLAASYRPARQAARIEPAAALRHE